MASGWEMRGPVGGYDFGNKRQCRRDVYGAFREAWQAVGGRVSEAQLLMLPGPLPDEIQLAIRTGFREKNIHIVDDNPAIVATHKKRYPHINTYGISLSRACERIAASGTMVHVAHLDFCSNISGALERELLAVRNARCWSPTAVVAVTVERAREHPEYFTEIKEPRPGALPYIADPRLAYVARGAVSPVDVGRIEMVEWMLAGHVGEAPNGWAAATLLRCGTYQSHKSPMLWMVFGFSPDHLAWLDFQEDRMLRWLRTQVPSSAA